MKKRFLAFILLCVSVMFVFAGCGGNDGLTQAEINTALKAYATIFEEPTIKSASAISIDCIDDDRFVETGLYHCPVNNIVNFLIEVTASDKYTQLNTTDLFFAKTLEGDLYFKFDYKDDILTVYFFNAATTSASEDKYWFNIVATVEYDKDKNETGNFKAFIVSGQGDADKLMDEDYGGAYYVFNKKTNKLYDTSKYNDDDLKPEVKSTMDVVAKNLDKAVDTKADYTEEYKKVMGMA